LALDGQLVSRFARDDADGATDGVAAEQRALRALQDLDTLDIEQVLIGTDGARVIDTVHVHANARIEIERKVVLTNATDRGRQHGVGAGERRTLIEVHIRRQPRQAVDVGHALVA